MFTKLREKILSKEFLSSKIKRIIILDSVDSTNNYGQLLDRPLDGTIVIANNQTNGKGRNGREWKSFNEKNIAISMILNYPKSNEHIGLTSILTANSVIQTLEMLDFYPRVKWPNDILINSKKISGILSEAVFKNNKAKSLIIGVGINVNCGSSDFFEGSFDYRIDPTSMFLEKNCIFSREDVIVSFLENFFKWVDEFKCKNFETILDFWLSKWDEIGKNISIVKNGKKINGNIYNVNTKGELILQVDNKEIVINSGEILV